MNNLDKRIRFIWNLQFRCNYSCQYCNINRSWEYICQKELYPPKEKWIKAWDSIYQKYGSAEVLFCGGELCIYPSFVEIAKRLSEKHYLGFVTNLSVDFKKFAEQIPPERVEFGIGASFHPIFADFNTFLNKVLMLREKGFKVWINYVAYPPQMRQMEYYKDKFKEHSLPFTVQPYRGPYKGIDYPEGYTEDERKFIRKVAGEHINVLKDMEYQLDRKKTKGKLCRAGQILAHVIPGGNVKRCGLVEEFIGNIFDENFRLLEEPLPCPVDHCICDFVYLVEEDEFKRNIDTEKIEKAIISMRDEGVAKESKGIKIALVLAPGWGRDAPFYSLALLTGILRSRNFGVSVFDINNLLYHKYSDTDKERQLWNWEESSFWNDYQLVSKYISENTVLIDSMVEKILTSGADVIGFMLYSTTKFMSLELTKKIKQKDKNKIIIFGGTECQRKSNWEELINEESVDAIMLDDADTSFPEFLETIEKEGRFKHCPGVVYKENGKLVDCGDRPPGRLDDLPFADFNDFDFNTYERPDNIKIAFSRGCSERCAYCSARCIWRGFRTMSSERIFQEIKYQVEACYRRMGQDTPIHIMLLDSLVNANMNIFIGWISKLAEARKDKDSPLRKFSWSAQVIIRPEMTFEIAKLAKEAGCIEFNCGIESGSAKVLKEMRKRYTPEIAEQVVRAIYDAGIPVRANFIVGFPTETEDDFKQTLDLIERNGRYMRWIYPSRTFCALEEFSYLNEHRQEFGVFPQNGGHYLFWESQEGKNNYLIRLDRYIRFCRITSSFVHKPLISGVEDIERDKWLCLGEYYQFKQEFKKALDCYGEYIKVGGAEAVVRKAIKFCNEKITDKTIDLSFKGEIKEEVVSNKIPGGLTIPEFRANIDLNTQELKNQKLILRSVPYIVFMQIYGPCNHNCIFCSLPEGYPFFRLEMFKKKFTNIFFVLHRAVEIILTGAGEFLLLPDAVEILSFFDNKFPLSKKIFTTNGTTFTPDIFNFLSNCNSKFSIEVSLHASNPELHKRLTGVDDFAVTIKNLRNLVRLSKGKENIKVSLIFLITAMNIQDLPNFLLLAKALEIKEIKCQLYSIYNVKGRFLSCFFKKSLANKILEQAERIAKELDMDISLPPKFQQPFDYYTSYSRNNKYLGKCTEAWTHIMFNSEGEVIPCYFFEKGSIGNIFEQDFMSIWNSKEYQELRTSFLDTKRGRFCRNCLKYNPTSIDNIKTHVITRGQTEEDLKAILAPTLSEEEALIISQDSLR